MVRTYIRKATARQRKGGQAGHGGDRSKAGLPAGDWSWWQEKGGRAAAAAAKAAAKANELLWK
jgi:hypothetical protein